MEIAMIHVTYWAEEELEVGKHSAPQHAKSMSASAKSVEHLIIYNRKM